MENIAHRDIPLSNEKSNYLGKILSASPNSIKIAIISEAHVGSSSESRGQALDEQSDTQKTISYSSTTKVYTISNKTLQISSSSALVKDQFVQVWTNSKNLAEAILIIPNRPTK